MTKEQEATLFLIRTAVAGKASPTDSALAQEIQNTLDWAKLIEFAMSQGVLGVCFEAVELLPPNQRPDIDNLMEWVGHLGFLNTLYAEHKSAVCKLASFFEEHGIYMMLLKGIGLSKYWPEPKHRPVGDIDCFFFRKEGSIFKSYGVWLEADRLIEEKLGVKVDDRHEHHTCYMYEGECVENHYDFVNTMVNKSSRELESIFKTFANKGERMDLSVKRPDLDNASSNDPLCSELSATIYTPSADFNALFLIRHLGQHFAGSGIILRQLLDWGFFMRACSAKVKWGIVIQFMKRAGMYELFLQFNAICRDYLGFPEFDGLKEIYDIEVDKALEERILEDILHPDFTRTKPKGNVLSVICFKTRRFFDNSWKRKLVYRESIFSQFLHGSIAHLKRFETIKD